MKLLTSIIILLVIASDGVWANQKIKLRDVQVLTLHSGMKTTSRRSSPVPQVHCLGGSAGCTAFIPKVVQCYNRGSDGFDVQWECKADMDMAYRFGRISVNCEGYDNPNDEYILKGSCGLEYTLDLTEYGSKHRHDHGSHRYEHSKQEWYPSPSQSSGYSALFGLACLVAVGVGIYYFCLAPSMNRRDQTVNEVSATQPPLFSSTEAPFASAPPPAPGFRPEFIPGQDQPPPDYYTATGTSAPGWRKDIPSATPGTGGGFWTGTAVGGVLGYLFGSSGTNRPYGGVRNDWGTGYSSGSGWGHDSSYRRHDSSSSGSSSGGGGGTRTASGFGGTSRR